MLVLGIDTATKTASIGLIDGDRMIGEYNLQVERVHSKRLMPMIDEVLRESGHSVRSLQAVVVSAGPGSFTGLRIGMAAAKGLAYALSVPLLGVSTLAALSLNCVPNPNLLCPVLDARMSEYYTALYRWENHRLTAVVQDSVMSKESFYEMLGSIDSKTVLIGPRPMLATMGLNDLPPGTIDYAPFHQCYPRGVSVATIGLRQLEDGAESALYTLQPKYLRRSQAEILYDNKKKV